MGLEVVVNEIIAEGRKRATAIEKEGLSEAKTILEEAKQRAEKSLKDRQEAGARDAERIRIQDVARAEFEAKKQVLHTQRGLLARLKEESLAAIRDAPDDQRRAWLATLLEGAAKQIPEGTVHVRAADEKLVSGTGGLTVVGDLDAAGGLVVDSADGNVSLDFRFESILEDVWPQALRNETNNLFR